MNGSDDTLKNIYKIADASELTSFADEASTHQLVDSFKD